MRESIPEDLEMHVGDHSLEDGNAHRHLCLKKWEYMNCSKDGECVQSKKERSPLHKFCYLFVSFWIWGHGQ